MMIGPGAVAHLDVREAPRFDLAYQLRQVPVDRDSRGGSGVPAHQPLIRPLQGTENRERIETNQIGEIVPVNPGRMKSRGRAHLGSLGGGV